MANTILGKIVNAEEYEDQPEIVMLGMLTSLVSASFMVFGATYLGLPVSANQTVCEYESNLTVASEIKVTHTVKTTSATRKTDNRVYHRVRNCC